jgi:membrane-associated phospholipid phosphatase
MSHFVRPVACSLTLVACLSGSSVAGQTLTPAAPPTFEGAASQSPLVGGTPAGFPAVQRNAPDRLFTDLFRGSIDDFRRLPSTDTLQWLGIGAVVAGMGHMVDRPVSGQMSSAASLDAPFAPGETIGGARFQLVSALATYAAGHAMGNGKVAQVGSDLLRAQILSQVLTASVKMSVRRERPDGTMYSFPSGHSSVTFASATVLQRNFGWKVGIPAYGVATYVAASRIQDKRHFLSDVAFGAAIGIVAGRTVTVGRGEGRFALAPMATSGGGGVSFTWVGNH